MTHPKAMTSFDFIAKGMKNRKGTTWLVWYGGKDKVQYRRLTKKELEALTTKTAPKAKKPCKGCDGSGWQKGENEGFICNHCDAACTCNKRGRDPECYVHQGDDT